MVPREPEDVSDDDNAPSLSSHGDSELEHDRQRGDIKQAQDGLDEEDYHTEESDGEAEHEEEDGDGIGELPPDAPLLPEELLKPLPSPAYSLQTATIPWEQMTRQEKRRQRNRNIQAKKKVWNRLRRDAQDTGVIEAGKMAQLKRGIVLAKNRIKNGRVEKKTKTRISGRQQLVEQRKRQAERSTSELMRPPQKRNTKTKR